MSDGARYHQTREGGSLHTDNVNAPAPWEFLVFGCVEPALIGGESVLTHTCFADHLTSTTVVESELFPQLRVRRSFERAWVKAFTER